MSCTFCSWPNLDQCRPQTPPAHRSSNCTFLQECPLDRLLAPFASAHAGQQRSCACDSNKIKSNSQSRIKFIVERQKESFPLQEKIPGTSQTTIRNHNITLQNRHAVVKRKSSNPSPKERYHEHIMTRIIAKISQLSIPVVYLITHNAFGPSQMKNSD
eukprot:6483740-Amphidinium_carterae.1